MSDQPMTPEFREFFINFCGRPESPHDNRNGLCKCCETHTPYDFQLLAVKKFQDSSGFTKAAQE